MARVLVTRQLPAGSLDPLAGHEIVGPPRDDVPMTGEELTGAVADVDGVVCLLTDVIDRAVLSAGARARLRVVSNVAVGVDNVDLDAASELGIAVCNTPDVLTEATAEVTLLLMLAATRRASEAEAALRAGDWSEWRFDGFLGRDLAGKTLGIVGFGRIGRAVARRAEAFGMEVRHWSRTSTGESGWTERLDDLLALADVVSLHVPGGDATRHLLDKRRIALLRPGAVVVNTSRGSVVDEVALAAALQRGALFAAGLDVYEREPSVHPDLLAAPHTVLLPHIGSATVETRLAMARLAAHGAAEILAGRRPTNCVVSPR